MAGEKKRSSTSADIDDDTCRMRLALVLLALLPPASSRPADPTYDSKTIESSESGTSREEPIAPKHGERYDVGERAVYSCVSTAAFDGLLERFNAEPGAGAGAGTPVVVAFYAPWCQRSKALRPELETAARLLGRRAAKFVAADATSPDLAATAAAFGVLSFPKLVRLLLPAAGEKGGQREWDKTEYTGEHLAPALAAWARTGVSGSASAHSRPARVKGRKGGDPLRAGLEAERRDPRYAADGRQPDGAGAEVERDASSRNDL